MFNVHSGYPSLITILSIFSNLLHGIQKLVVVEGSLAASVHWEQTLFHPSHVLWVELVVGGYEALGENIPSNEPSLVDVVPWKMYEGRIINLINNTSS